MVKCGIRSLQMLMYWIIVILKFKKLKLAVTLTLTLENKLNNNNKNKIDNSGIRTRYHQVDQ